MTESTEGIFQWWVYDNGTQTQAEREPQAEGGPREHQPAVTDSNPVTKQETTGHTRPCGSAAYAAWSTETSGNLCPVVFPPHALYRQGTNNIQDSVSNFKFLQI